MIPADNLKHIVMKILMKELSNNWSLEAYRDKIENTVKMTYDHKETIAGVTQNMTEMGNIIASMQLRLTELEDQGTEQNTVAVRLRQELNTLLESYNRLNFQVTDLFNIIGNQAAEITRLEGEIRRMSADNTIKWSKHDVEHSSITARLGSLEELRRLGNTNRGQEQTNELNNAFMAGFQRCLEVQIMNGSFQRSLLSNKSFMDLVKDKDALLVKLLEKESQGYWREEGTQSQDQHQQQQQQ